MQIKLFDLNKIWTSFSDLIVRLSILPTVGQYFTFTTYTNIPKDYGCSPWDMSKFLVLEALTCRYAANVAPSVVRALLLNNDELTCATCELNREAVASSTDSCEVNH
jgi:hypothetical protein